MMKEYMEKDEDNLEEFMGTGRVHGVAVGQEEGMLKESMGKEKNM